MLQLHTSPIDSSWSPTLKLASCNNPFSPPQPTPCPDSCSSTLHQWPTLPLQLSGSKPYHSPPTTLTHTTLCPRSSHDPNHEHNTIPLADCQPHPNAMSPSSAKPAAGYWIHDNHTQQQVALCRPGHFSTATQCSITGSTRPPHVKGAFIAVTFYLHHTSTNRQQEASTTSLNTSIQPQNSTAAGQLCGGTLASHSGGLAQATQTTPTQTPIAIQV